MIFSSVMNKLNEVLRSNGIKDSSFSTTNFDVYLRVLSVLLDVSEKGRSTTVRPTHFTRRSRLVDVQDMYLVVQLWFQPGIF